MSANCPNFLIVGAAKCGTTSLAAILDEHPDCCFSRPKEASFFQDNISFEANPNFSLGWNWYQQHFEHYSGEPCIGEGTPSYSDRSRSPQTAKRIHAFNPKMKIIYMARDPLDRQRSAWNMQRYFYLQGLHREQVETEWAAEGFDAWMRKQRDVQQWDVNRYSYQLDAYRDVFPSDQILACCLEDWSNDISGELKRICAFLELDPDKLVVSRPQGENRSIDRRIEPRWLRQVRTSAAGKLLKKLMPVAIRRQIGQSVATAPPTSNDVLSAEVRSEFLKFVGEDCLRFLDDCRRPRSLWKSLRSVTQNKAE